MPRSEITLLWESGDLAAVEDALEDLLDPDGAERSVIDGMLQSGAHPKAVINKIKADRMWSR